MEKLIDCYSVSRHHKVLHAWRVLLRKQLVNLTVVTFIKALQLFNKFWIFRINENKLAIINNITNLTKPFFLKFCFGNLFYRFERLDLLAGYFIHRLDLDYQLLMTVRDFVRIIRLGANIDILDVVDLTKLSIVQEALNQVLFSQCLSKDSIENYLKILAILSGFSLAFALVSLWANQLIFGISFLLALHDF